MTNNVDQRSSAKILPRHDSVRGFTLIELLISLGIMLVVSAFALPRVQSSVANYQLRASASSVAGVIQSTRYLAISQGYPFQVVFSQSAGTYQLKNDPTVTGTFVACAPPTCSFTGAVPFGTTSATLGADATLQFSGGGSVKSIVPVPVGSVIPDLVITRSGRTATITVSNYGNVRVVYGP